MLLEPTVRAGQLYRTELANVPTYDSNGRYSTLMHKGTLFIVVSKLAWWYDMDHWSPALAHPNNLVERMYAMVLVAGTCRYVYVEDVLSRCAPTGGRRRQWAR